MLAFASDKPPRVHVKGWRLTKVRSRKSSMEDWQFLPAGERRFYQPSWKGVNVNVGSGTVDASGARIKTWNLRLVGVDIMPTDFSDHRMSELSWCSEDLSRAGSSELGLGREKSGSVRWFRGHESVRPCSEGKWLTQTPWPFSPSPFAAAHSHGLVELIWMKSTRVGSAQGSEPVKETAQDSHLISGALF